MELGLVPVAPVVRAVATAAVKVKLRLRLHLAHLEAELVAQRWILAHVRDNWGVMAKSKAAREFNPATESMPAGGIRSYC